MEASLAFTLKAMHVSVQEVSHYDLVLPKFELMNISRLDPFSKFCFCQMVLDECYMDCQNGIVLFPTSILDDIVRHFLWHGNYSQFNVGGQRHLNLGFQFNRISLVFPWYIQCGFTQGLLQFLDFTHLMAIKFLPHLHFISSVLESICH